MLSINIDGLEYALDDGAYAYFLGEANWGMEPTHRLSERGPQQDGDTDLGFKADPRYGKLFFEMVADTLYELKQMDDRLMTLFRPDRNLRIKWTYTHPTDPITYPDIVRQFDVVYWGDMDFPFSSREGFAQKTVVTLKASDPTCYDPTVISVNFQIGGGADTWEVPFTVPIIVGASTINVSQPIYYDGNAICYPHYMRITGPIHDPVVTITQGEVTRKLDFTGDTIDAAHFYEIDLRYGYKTIVDNHGVNQIGKLTTDSDLALFRIEPPGRSLEIESPIPYWTSMRITGSAVTADTNMQVKYYNRYLGV